MKIVSLVGARPQFIKEAMLGKKVCEVGAWEHILVHSGQHYDINMSDIFFQELGIPSPRVHLGIGSGSHAAMTAAALVGMEKVLLDEKPDALLVYGDTNTTLAGALASVKLGLPVIHVEAGIRMLPHSMPEEINRVLTDRVSALMCCCSEIGRRNLEREGITSGVEVCGDLMLDVYLAMRPKISGSSICKNLGLEDQRFVLATIHRDYNTDSPDSLRGIVEGFVKVQERTGFRVVLPLHPRTRKRILQFGLDSVISQCTLLEPQGYFDLQALVMASEFVVSDSGGLQKEAYYAGKRCIVVMPDTGWRELIDSGWNVLANPECESLLASCEVVLKPKRMPENLYGDGNAADQIIDAVKRFFL